MSREVLAPPLQRIGTNRCYRVNLVHEDFGGYPSKRLNMQQTQTASPSKQGYTEPDLYAEDDDDAEESYTVEELPNFMFKLTMHVPQPFYGGIIGFKGSNKRRIESETQTEIHVPRGGNSEDLTIKGKTRSSVCTARRRITLQVASLRKRIKPTHFLCIPLNSGEIRERYIEFKKEILAAKLPSIGEDLFQTENAIHLTLCTCVLLDDTERAKALQLLESCKQFVINCKTPFEIKVSGLEIMNDDPSSVRVLYASIVAPELQQFADGVMKHFMANGLNNEVRESVKLHMTIMNNRYRQELNPDSANNFDAREVLKRFGDFHFGTARSTELQLCVLGSKNEKLGEYYKVSGTLKLE